MVRKPLDYSQEIIGLANLFRRIASAHGCALDHVLHDVEEVLVEDKNFTKEAYLGIFQTHTPDKQARLTVPASVTAATAYHLYRTEWGDLIYRPVQEPRHSRLAPVIEAS